METTYTPATWPAPIQTKTLPGKLITLEPLDPVHIPGLCSAGSDPRVWQFTTSRADSPDEMNRYVRDLLNGWSAGFATPFAVRSLASGEIVGCTRLKEIDRNHRRAVLGSWYAPRAWRTGANLEAKLLLLGFAFDELELTRVEFHTDSRNTQSRTSLEKLGATFEGVLRAHQITRDGGLRDSAIYSILRGEWPTIQGRNRARIR